MVHEKGRWDKMKSFNTIIRVCCHHVALRYWDFDHELTEELKEILTEQGEERARECITKDCCSGELNALFVDEDGNDHEIRGWWEIEQ